MPSATPNPWQPASCRAAALALPCLQEAQRVAGGRGVKHNAAVVKGLHLQGSGQAGGGGSEDV